MPDTENATPWKPALRLHMQCRSCRYKYLLEVCRDLQDQVLDGSLQDHCPKCKVGHAYILTVEHLPESA